MKKYMIIILAVLILLSSCSNNSKASDVSLTKEIPASDTMSGSKSSSESVESTPEPITEPELFDIDSISARSINGLLKEETIPEDTTQLILVAVDGNYDKMYLLEKGSNDMWQIVHGPFDVQIGLNGLGKEEEGDAKSPQGIYALGYAFGSNTAPTGTIWPWRTSETGDLWIEDSNSKYYNMFVQEGTVQDADWKNYSNLNIAAFARAVEIRYNSEREPGAGSAIFLHIWISPKKDTNGCTSISRENIETLIAWLDPEANTMIAQLPHELIGNGDLVYLSDYSSDIKADIKFAQDDNFFGTKLEGYNDNQIITKADVAMALVKANEMLKNYKVKLVVYDAYRPMSAFYQIRDWMNSPDDTTDKEIYYTDIDKTVLGEEYFSYNSDRLYTRAQVIHAGLTDLYGVSLDMGGEYMVFNEFTSYVSEGLAQEEIYNRELLHDIMLQAGFTPVENQWWKFEYNPYLYDVKFDEIIE